MVDSVVISFKQRCCDWEINGGGGAENPEKLSEYNVCVSEREFIGIFEVWIGIRWVEDDIVGFFCVDTDSMDSDALRNNFSSVGERRNDLSWWRW